MRIILELLAVIFLAFVIGALLTWPVYLLLQPFVDIAFNKLITHITSFSGLALIFVFLKYHRILNRQTAGFRIGSRNYKKDIACGLLSGLLIMGVLEFVLYVSGVHIPEPELVITAGFIMVLLVKAVASGIMVALIEETLYRGALLGGLLKTTGVVPAIITSSVIYAAVHFLSYPAVDDPASINVWTGLKILPGAFAGFADPAIIDAFLSLTAFGVLLALVRIYTGNIITSMAVHAGVVIAIRFIKDFTDYNYNTAHAYLVSAHDHLLGYLALSWLLLLIVILISVNKKSRLFAA